MTEKIEKLEAGLASDLNRELEALRQENLVYKNSVAVFSTTLSRLTTENEELKSSNFSKDFKRHWRMTFAGQAMAAIVSSQPEFSDEKVISYTAFMIADAMLDVAEPSV